MTTPKKPTKKQREAEESRLAEEAAAEVNAELEPEPEPEPVEAEEAVEEPEPEVDAGPTAQPAPEPDTEIGSLGPGQDISYNGQEYRIKAVSEEGVTMALLEFIPTGGQAEKQKVQIPLDTLVNTITSDQIVQM